MRSLLKRTEIIDISNMYGDVRLEVSEIGEDKIFFMNRHGINANLPPHRINYHANIQAFTDAHVDCLISVATVGSLDKKIKPDDIVIPHDFLDMTKTRRYTFYDDSRTHVDMTQPYCPVLRGKIIEAASKIVTTYDKGVYLATEGPRLETTAEIRFFSKYADIVGMTGVPEVILARERGLCYASICLVVNMAAGLQERITSEELQTIYNKKEPLISEIIISTIPLLKTTDKNCRCNIKP
ncbi:MAG: MTAP family purine nucleoside phosphorylase [Candidatus Thermoplasmatota archaeon]